MTMDKKMMICPKPEQMMICPSYPEQDKSLCSQCHHFHEHVFEKGTCDRHLTYCKGCIPVPSTPASDHIGDGDKMVAQYGTNVAPSTPSSVPLPPDELLTFNSPEIAKLFSVYQLRKECGTEWLLNESLKAQLLKCHQSEAAEIASLQADIEELNILSGGNSEVYEARIKELEELNYKQSQMKCNRCPYNNPQEAAIRADQNKKIGEWLEKWYHTSGNNCWEILSKVIAKLQKGEEVE
jgi:hypothetical protein